jgi:hypothetical protein
MAPQPLIWPLPDTHRSQSAPGRALLQHRSTGSATTLLWRRHRRPTARPWPCRPVFRLARSSALANTRQQPPWPCMQCATPLTGEPHALVRARAPRPARRGAGSRMGAPRLTQTQPPRAAGVRLHPPLQAQGIAACGWVVSQSVNQGGLVPVPASRIHGLGARHALLAGCQQRLHLPLQLASIVLQIGDLQGRTARRLGTQPRLSLPRCWWACPPTHLHGGPCVTGCPIHPEPPGPLVGSPPLPLPCPRPHNPSPPPPCASWCPPRASPPPSSQWPHT